MKYVLSSLVLLLTIMQLSACSSAPVQEQAAAEKKVEAVHPPTPASDSGAEAAASQEKAQAPAHEESHASSDEAKVVLKPDPKAAPAHHIVKGVDPSKSLGWLKNGNLRFRKGFLRKDGQGKQDIQRLSKGQQPHAIVLSCSDSRVPPEIVFDQKLGEIFVVRTAGEALDANAIGSVEYAIEHLGARLLVVMGHTSCGAVKAALGTLNGGDAGSPALNKLVADIHPRIREVASSQKPSADLSVESFANAKGVAADLMKRSSIVREAVARGQVVVKSSLYHLDSGEVDFE